MMINTTTNLNLAHYLLENRNDRRKLKKIPVTKLSAEDYKVIKILTAHYIMSLNRFVLAIKT